MIDIIAKELHNIDKMIVIKKIYYSFMEAYITMKNY